MNNKAILVVIAVPVALCALCGYLLVGLIVSDIIRYGASAQNVRRNEPISQQQAGAQPQHASQSSATGSDELVRRHHCRACHGQDLRGQQLGAMYARGLTASGVAGQWSEAEFIAAMRTGQRPDGSQMSDAMPWRAIGKASDSDLEQLWAYLKSLP